MIYDINLLPKSKKNTTSKVGYYMIVIGIICAIILVGGFCLFPLQLKKSLSKNIQAQQEELSTYLNVQEEYGAVNSEVNKLNDTVSVLGQLRESKVSIAALLNDFEKAMPKNVKATSVKMDDGLITFEGTSSTYKELAQFIVNLRAIENVLSVSFASAAADVDSISAITQSKTFYNYTINVKYNIQDVVTVLQSEEVAAKTQEEVVQNEAD